MGVELPVFRFSAIFFYFENDLVFAELARSLDLFFLAWDEGEVVLLDDFVVDFIGNDQGR